MFIAPDAVWDFRGFPPLRGREAVSAFFEEVVRTSIVAIDLLKWRADGAMGWSLVDHAVTFRDEAPSMTLRAVFIWSRSGEDWLVEAALGYEVATPAADAANRRGRLNHGMRRDSPRRSPAEGSMRTGLVWHELYMWHQNDPTAASLVPAGPTVQPGEFVETPETKRRFKNLLDSARRVALVDWDVHHRAGPRGMAHVAGLTMADRFTEVSWRSSRARSKYHSARKPFGGR